MTDRREDVGIRDELERSHPWLKYRHEAVSYLSPAYYTSLLKPYRFEGKSDVDLLIDAWRRVRSGKSLDVLEIGPGTGRGINALLADGGVRSVQLVDQSLRMLAYLRQQIPKATMCTFTSSDALRFLLATDTHCDFAFSMWSLSHAVHQAVHSLGMREGTILAQAAIKRLLTTVITAKGTFFLIHFDSSSDEQHIALRQRQRILPFLHPDVPTPSQQIMDDVTSELAVAGVVDICVERLLGEPIVYKSMDQALEIFFNFHMEGIFNDSPLLWSVLNEVAAELSQYQQPNGEIAIIPKCIIYNCRRLI